MGDQLDFELDFWETPLSIDFKRNQWSVLVGKTGHGKSYLIEQIADILKLHGANISYVAQSPYLYNDTVEANIFLGRKVDDVMREKAFLFLKLFDIHLLAGSEEALFQMEVGENGKRLSGGQIKRLALVRSFMSGADILLWDDPFSSVDVILEGRIVDRIKDIPELANKTVIFTSHRLTTVKRGHQVTFVERGEGIVERGGIGELLKENSRTYEHFAKQMV